jgi:hypothetical protein
MRIFLLGFFFIITGCATKYMLPGNRFLTPETQGEAFRGQFEVQKTTGNELSIDTRQNRTDQGVLYSEVSRTGFLLSNSLFNRFDLYWSHVAGGNSLLGGKFQFLGGSRVTKETGHKLALAAAVGSNEHETDDGVVEFTLGGQEFMLLYGFRWVPELMTYATLSQATYNFDGEVRTSGPLSGQTPKIDSKIISLSGGLEGSIDVVFAKLEFTYQAINTDKTKAYSRFITGFSIGLAW